MNILDENIIESQAQLLRSWRIGFRQIGQNVGRAGMKDDEIIPLLHSLRRPTLFTRDLRFYTRDEPHAAYCIVCLAIEQGEIASFARRFLKHPAFDTQSKRMGAIVTASQSGLRVKRLGLSVETEKSWPR